MRPPGGPSRRSRGWRCEVGSVVAGGRSQAVYSDGYTRARTGVPMSILIDGNTPFIVQGITGREAVNLTRECLDYGVGAKIVGGVTPGRKGRDVHGVPVYDTVAQAVEAHGEPIDGSVVTVPPAFTKDAVFEAIDNGIRLIVIVTERIPRRDVAEMVEFAALPGSRLLGPNR